MAEGLGPNLRVRRWLVIALPLLVAVLIAVTLILHLSSSGSDNSDKWPNFGNPTCSNCAKFASMSSFQLFLGGVPASIPSHLSYVEADLFDISKAQINRLKTLASQGTVIGCYIDAGTYESWRPDAKSYPPSLLGKGDIGWIGERWVDIADPNATFAQILEKRVKLCKEHGFQAVDFDNVDGYQNNTGFKISPTQQLSFNTFLANLAHHYGLLVALKNDLDQFKSLAPKFDFAVEESCIQYQACQNQQNFADGESNFAATKAIFDVEYQHPSASACRVAKNSNVTVNFARLQLSTVEVSCQSVLQDSMPTPQ